VLNAGDSVENAMAAARSEAAAAFGDGSLFVEK
jgi:acetyl/propionyl-CoA carboxylase alpha subunit